MFNLAPGIRIFVSTKPADMRCSFNGLLALVRLQFPEDPYNGSLFLFRSRRGDFIKILWFDLDGFAIFSKKLEEGRFRFPDVRFVDGKYEPIEIERADLMMLLEGIDSESVKRLKRYRHARRNQVASPAPKIAATRR